MTEVKIPEGFTPWAGGPQPLPNHVRVEIMFANGERSTRSAGLPLWGHKGVHPDYYIIAYRVVGGQEDQRAACGTESNADSTKPNGPQVANPAAAHPTKTLRDEFAMAALTGLFAGSYNNRVVVTADADAWAANAYVFADSMMKERDK